MNKAILVGRLTADPELKATTSGVSVCSFSVAVNRRFARAGEERKADFIGCVAWRQTAEFICNYFAKGRMIGLVGSIQTRDWTDNEGRKRYATEVIVDEAYFIESKSQQEAQHEMYRSAGYTPQDKPPTMNDFQSSYYVSEDDLPF